MDRILALNERVRELTFNKKGLFTILSIDTFDGGAIVFDTLETEENAKATTMRQLHLL